MSESPLGTVLDKEDCPELPDLTKQKHYRSMVTKVQFAAYWTRFDISYPAAQLARFLRFGWTVSLGSSHASDQLPHPQAQPQDHVSYGVNWGPGRFC
jgi:hypothetical protein